MPKGIIYIMETSVKGLIKIGMTRSDQYETRMKFLESNGYFNVGGMSRYFAIETDSAFEKEQLLHQIFSKSRVDGSELFALDAELVKKLLMAFDGKIIYPKQETLKPMRSRSSPKPPLTFEMLGIPIGSTLTFTKNTTITCKTINEKNKVKYDGKTYSISALAMELLHTSAAQGGAYFTYQGKTLVQMREEIEKNKR